jgi:hypothetical protein
LVYRQLRATKAANIRLRRRSMRYAQTAYRAARFAARESEAAAESYFTDSAGYIKCRP